MTSEEEQLLLQRITRDESVMAGQPVLKGTRLTVTFVLGLLAHGATVDEIVTEYQGLTSDDLRACLLFASRAMAGSIGSDGTLM